MASRPLSAEDFISLAIEALRAEVAPHLPPEATARLGDVICALTIAAREMRAADTEMPHWALLDSIFDDGDGTLEQLAREIRSGTVSVGTRPTLAADLSHLLEAEIAVRSPPR